MSKIYVEVPTTTNQTTISIPYGEEEEYCNLTEYLTKKTF